MRQQRHPRPQFASLHGPLLSLYKAQWPDLQWGCAPKPATEPGCYIFRNIAGFEHIVEIGAFWLHFGIPRTSEKQGFRMEGVAFFEKSRGWKNTKNMNLAIEEREAREKREPQASQATENTRREAQTTARRTRAKHHEAQPSQRGESNASIKIASAVGRVQPLLARCARSPGVWSWSVS